MWHIGIDLHRRMVVMSAVNDSGEVVSPVTIECRNIKPFSIFWNHSNHSELLSSLQQPIVGYISYSLRKEPFCWPIQRNYA
ncbi:hypothetical protein MalM14_50540 [Gimesia chilikensis]|nr:hypothetical protein MalM14_50540 [Gimesia chilikensis]